MSSLPWSSKGSKATPIAADELMILDSEDPTPSTQNKRITVGSITGTGEANTSSNSGTGEGLAQAKSGVDLPFKSLLGETDRIIISGQTDTVTFTLDDKVVTIDKANTFGAFPQIFQSDEICIESPNGNLYHFVATDITVDRNITIPLLPTDDIFVFEAFTQSLSNKTLVTPTIANFINANHDHSTASQGGQITNTALVSGVFSNITGLGTQTQDLDMGGFDVLNAGGITINNPADTFQYILTPDALIADRILNLPLMTGTDTMVLEAFTQTLTNKTIDASLNTLSNIAVASLADGTAGELITWDVSGVVDTVSTGTAGQILTSNGSGAAPTFQAAGASVPVPDTTPIVEGSDDDTKLLRFEIDGFTTATTRVLTPPDTDGVIVLEDFAQTLTNKTLTAPTISTILNTGNLTLPTDTDTLVGRATTDTLTNKTIDGDDNTISDVNETQQTVSVGASGFVLTSNGAGLAPTYQVTGAASQTPWASDIDAANFELQDLNRVEFNAAGDITDATTVDFISVNSNNMIFNQVTAGDEFQFNFAGTNNYTFENTGGADWLGHNIRNVDHFESNATNPATAGTIRLGNLESIEWRDFGDTTEFGIFLNASDEFEFDKTIDTANNGIIIGTSATIEFGSSDATISQAAGTDLLYDVASNDSHILRVADAIEYEFDEDNADFNNNNLINAIIDGDLNTVLDINETQLDVSVGTVGFVLTSNGAGISPTYQVTGAAAQTPWGSNIDGAEFDLINVGLLNQKEDDNTAIHELEANHATPADGQVIGQIDFIDDDDGGTRTTYSQIRSVIQSPTDPLEDGELFFAVVQNGTLTDYISLNEAGNNRIVFAQSIQVGVNNLFFDDLLTGLIQDSADLRYNVDTGGIHELRIATVPEYSFSATDLTFTAGNNLVIQGSGATGFIDIGEITTPADPAMDVGRLYVKDDGGTSTLFFRDSTGTETNLLTVGGAQTPWTSDIDADNFDLRDLSNLEFGISTGIPAGTVPYIANEATGITVNVPTGDSFSLDVNNTLEYTFDATTADFNSNNLTGVAILTIESQMNLSSGNSLVWGGSGDRRITNLTSGFEFEVETGDTFNYEINSVLEYSISATELTLNSGNNLVIEASGATGFIDIGEITTPANPAMDVGRLYVKDDGGTTTLFFRDNAGTETNLLLVGSSQTPWLSDIDADGFDLTDLSNLEFRETTGLPLGSVPYIAHEATGITLNVPTSDSFSIDVNGSVEYSFNATALTMSNNNLDLGSGEIQFTTGGTTISEENSDLTYVVSTGNFHDFQVNAVSIMALTATELSIVDTAKMAFNGPAGDQTIESVGTSLTFDTGGTHLFRIATVDNAQISADGFSQITGNLIGFDDITPSSATQTIVGDIGGLTYEVPDADTHDFTIDGTSELEITATQIDFKSNSLAQCGDINLDEGATVIGDTSTADAAFRDIGTAANPTNDDAGDMYYNTTSNEYRFFNGVSWVSMQGGEFVTWTQDHDANSFDLNNLSNLLFTTTTETPLTSIAAIFSTNGTSLTFNIASLNTFTFLSGGVNIMSVDSTEINFDDQNLVGLNGVSGSVGSEFKILGDTLQIKQTDATAVFELEADHAVPGAAQVIGQIDFYDDDSLNARRLYSQISSTIEDPLSTSIDSKITIKYANANTLVTAIDIGEADTIDFFRSLDMNDQQITRASLISFDAADDVSIQDSGAGDLQLDVATGDEIILRINNSNEYNFGSTRVDLTGNDITTTGKYILGSGIDNFIQRSGSDNVYDTTTGGSHLLNINGTTEYSFSASTADFLGNAIDNVLSLTMDGATPGTLTMNGANFRLTYAGGGSIQLRDAVGTEYEFNSSLANFMGNNLLNVPQILDANGLESLIFTSTASAVNELTLVNAATATPVEIQATGDDTDIDVQFTPKGTGTFYGNRETWAWPLTDESTAPTTGVKFTTEPAPYDMSIEDAIAGLTVAGTGAALFTIDVLKEDTAPNTNTFTSIFTTNLVTIDDSEFTSTTAATQPNITTTTWEKGRRLQLSITTLDTNGLARGAKISLITHATAK